MKPCRERHIVMRSIDLGAMEVVRTYDELAAFNKVGSPFSIPKAALVLAGFHPDFCAEAHASLEAQLEAFGAGIEITLLSAIPAGSGLGTSSILASTVLGAVNDFCDCRDTSAQCARCPPRTADSVPNRAHAAACGCRLRSAYHAPCGRSRV